MGKPVPLPPILSGGIDAPFLGDGEPAATARQIANSANGWHALVYALGKSGPAHIANAKRSLHGVQSVMKRHR